MQFNPGRSFHFETKREATAILTASGTECMVVLAETRDNDPARLEELRSRIVTLATDLVGTPPDDIILTPPQTLLKTSSGKIRRAANRELYERGRLLNRPKAMWWQMMRLALTGIVPELRRAMRFASEKLHAVHSWIVFGLISPFLWVLVVLLPHTWRWPLLHGAASFFTRVSCIRLLVHGLENVPGDRPCVLVANHASYIDSLILIACLPFEVSFVAKAELAGNAGVRLFLKRMRTEFVERFDKQKGIEDARRMVSRVLAGQSLLFFPEGTFCRMPGVLPFHMGAFISAADAGVPVVPIAIRGTRSILRDGSWLPRRGTVTVTIGSPIEPYHMKPPGDADSWAISMKLCDAARVHILCHCGEPDLSHERSPI